MIAVVDTCAIVWNAEGSTHLTKAAKDTIEDAFSSDSLFISSVSIWEIAWLMRRGRLNIKAPFREFIDDILISYKYVMLDITPAIADIAASFPPEVNSDPGDRLIAATAVFLDAPLVTADKNLRKSKAIKTIW
ncbi:MAG TPA: type II toxin-antitoxin system VapC family toxin [Candidatus Kapabacteria bacterium]|nr:type II toxin-antitoxin system VapC family toxin [Candidatus Kapabacteria bacterium]